MANTSHPTLLEPTGCAEKILDCPEWVQGSVALQYLGIPDQNMRLFDAGLIAIEWHVSDVDKWWRFCYKRGADVL